MLAVRDVAMEFDGLHALSGVSLIVREKEIKALIGPNGAGKTTLFNVVCGLFPCTRGEVFFRDQEITRMKSHEICRLGMGRTFQIPRLFKQMTVLENVKTGCFPWTRAGIISCALKTPFSRSEAQEIECFSREILAVVGLQKEVDTLAERLPIGEQKLLDIGRALATKPAFVLLDEPAGGLNDRETEQLAKTILTLRDSFGITILLVEHDMNLVMDVADTIVVLNHGEKIAEGTPGEIQNNEDVIAAYLGRETADRKPPC